MTHRHYSDEDCPICEAIAEDRAERAASEAEARMQENRYEARFWGQS